KAPLGNVLNDAREVFHRPLLGCKSGRRMNERDLSICKTECFDAFSYIFSGLGRDAQHCPWSISNRNACPTEQCELLFDGVSLLLPPEQQRRRRLLIMKLGVLISFETDAVTCAGGSRQKSRSRAAVKVVNNVVITRAQFT